MRSGTICRHLVTILVGIGAMQHAHGAATFADQVKGGNIAAVIIAQNASAKPFLKHAQSRMESILLDAGITVLDRRKADELRTAAPTLEDPGAFVTAEWFVENAGKFDIKGLLAVYLSADATAGLAKTFSATAHADIRFISDASAKVQALSTSPMGAPGNPPSDGLTANSALINAVQRAVDKAAGKMGLELMDPARPRAVKLTLEGPLDRSPKGETLPSENPKAFARWAELDDAKWRKEEATAAAKAPAGQLAAVAGYIIDTDFHRRPPRVFGSRIHLIDLDAERELMTFDCHPVGKKASGEKGDRDVQDCGFITSWRYLAAVTGNSLFFWDTERGQLMVKKDLPRAVTKATLELAHAADGGTVLIVQGRKRSYGYQITRAQ